MTGQKTVQNQRKRISFLLHTAALPWDGSFTSIASDMDELHQRALANLLYETDTDVAVVSDETSIGNVANATGVSGRLFAGDIFRESSYNINIPGASNKNLMRLTRTAKIQAYFFGCVPGYHGGKEPYRPRQALQISRGLPAMRSFLFRGQFQAY